MNQFGENLEEEFARYKKVITQEYEQHSIIGDATHTRVFNETTDRDLHFMNILVSEVVPREWFGNPTICPEPFFSDIGRSIALGEENHLVQTILGKAKTEPMSISEIRPLQILDVTRQFVREGYNEPVLFVPAELSVPLHIETEVVEFVDNREFLRIGPNLRAQLFLTSKYVKLKDLLIVDKSFGRWIFKRGDFSETLTIEMAPTQYNNVRILAKTRVSYEIVRPEATTILRLPENQDQARISNI